MNKIDNIQKKVLRFLLNGYEIDYKTLLNKCNNCTIEVRRLRTLASETFKTLNDLNPPFMKNLFAKQEVSNRRKNNLEIPNRNSVKYRDNSIRSLETHVWSSLPKEIEN